MRRAERPFGEQARPRAAAARPPSEWSSLQSPRRTRAAAECPGAVAPAWSCPPRAVRSSAGCDRRPRRLRVHGARRPGRGGRRGRGLRCLGCLRCRGCRWRSAERPIVRWLVQPRRPPPRAIRTGSSLRPVDDRRFGEVVVRQQQGRARRGAGLRRQSPARPAPAEWLRPATARRRGRCRRGRGWVDRRRVAASMPRAIGRSKAGPAFRTIGRRQVDRDAMGGEVEAGVPDRGADAVAAFTHARVRQPDQLKVRKAEAHVDFDVHRQASIPMTVALSTVASMRATVQADAAKAPTDSGVNRRASVGTESVSEAETERGGGLRRRRNDVRPR